MTAPPEIAPADPRAPETSALLSQSRALMAALFPAEANHYLDDDALAAPDVRFFAARVAGRTDGCAALALRADADGPYGEVKSMFVAPAARGAGIGGALLDRIEAEARALGLAVLRLESGDRLHAAHRLYAAHGFAPRGPFGAYADGPHSLFMEKRLA